MLSRHGTAGGGVEGETSRGDAAVHVAWNSGGVETLVIRGGRKAAISQIKTNVFPLEIIAVDGDQDSENGEPFEREFVPGKNLRGDAERKMAESAWLRNALEASLRPKTVRKVFLKCAKGCKLTHATFGHVYLDSRVRIWHIAGQGWEVSRYSLGRAWIEALFWLGIGLGEPIFMYIGY